MGVTVGRGQIGGLVRGLEINMGLAGGELGVGVAFGLGKLVISGVAIQVLVEEVVTLFQQLQEINKALDQLSDEGVRRRQLEAQARAIAARIQELEATLTMPPMWKRDP